MSKNALRYPESAIEGGRFGTARVREDRTIGRSFAEREVLRRTGNQPNSEFDEIASGDLDRPIFPPAMTAKRSKYRNTKCEYDGIKFDSKRERSRWFELSRQQAAGHISELRLQVEFELIARQRRSDGSIERAVEYVADFTYRNSAGELVVEDVKSAITRKNKDYVIKRKLMLREHGITIQEVE
ncbi:hypothetical protein WT60_11590 [Burkholderia sp. MSMB617WGS]|uniref:Gp72 n=1 Tax=Burkholderia savannae TaxID=1637837 RepID=A0ABR5TEX0_9BURK|nr:DUF1064 domain-containing protein [Burkholderia savannae]AOK47416.1 hypothetical protein WT60_11590 [Burkholderia sp. MSMB617WGS]KWZ43421.1 hypothetical protein WS72_11485 [Burkholderia savannae]KWZ46442.1 hypothetical protein WS73_20610 [Burkholderia savannae]